MKTLFIGFFALFAVFVSTGFCYTGSLFDAQGNAAKKNKKTIEKKVVEIESESSDKPIRVNHRPTEKPVFVYGFFQLSEPNIAIRFQEFLKAKKDNPLMKFRAEFSDPQNLHQLKNPELSARLFSDMSYEDFKNKVEKDPDCCGENKYSWIDFGNHLTKQFHVKQTPTYVVVVNDNVFYKSGTGVKVQALIEEVINVK